MTPPSGRLRLVLGAVLVAAVVIGVLLLGRSGAATLVPRLVEGVRALGWAGLPLYALAYLPVSLAMLPASPMTVGAGYLFGWAPGVAVGAVASVAGASLTLQVGRTLGRPLARRLATALPRFEAVSRAVERSGFEVVALLRVTPLIPFPWLNYVLGLTRLPVWKFALASLVGMLPGNVVYAYLGSRADGVVDALSRPALPGASGLALGAGVLVLTVGLVWLAGRRLARDLKGPSAAAPGSEKFFTGAGDEVADRQPPRV
jgi:uncharacterized membrane protein YdjX (TVP38/TMEM64 family)